MMDIDHAHTSYAVAIRTWLAHHFTVQPWVFFISGGLIMLFVFFGIAFTAEIGALANTLQTAIATHLGWYYILIVAALLPFAVWLIFSRFGDIRLGADDETPEFGFFAWFAMLFSAGMGIGLLFYSIAEPISHFSAPPVGAGGTIEAAKRAMNLTFFHWGLHAWAIYVVVGLALAYFAYRHKLPLTIRSALYPLIGRRIYGPIGHAVDIAAVVGTLFGVATSLGLGAMQVNAGLHHVFGIEESSDTQLIIIALITAVATVSVVLGLKTGIRRLSEFNLLLGLCLLLFVLFAGPTTFILRGFVQDLGYYVQHLAETTLWTNAYRATTWQGSWTVFYWGWWIAWSPFVGMFIARVSRGRTIREFVTGVLLVPTLLTFLWLAVFGHTALHLEMFGGGGIAKAVQDNLPTALYVTLEHFPLARITSLLATLVVVTFFVTSSDSGSLVIDIITAGGKDDPPVAQRIFWALLEGAVGAVLLVAGGLHALQTGSITTALPFSLVLVLICVGLVKALRAERPR